MFSYFIWLGPLLVVIFSLAFLSSRISQSLALRFGVVDDPKSDPARKFQKSPIPLMGATGFVIVALLATSLLWLANKFDWFGLQMVLQQGLYQPFRLAWIVVATLLLVLAGYLDDANKISNKGRFLIVGLALLIAVILGNLEITALSYPFNTLIPAFPGLAQLLAFVWLGFCLFATKVLDGHDGLVTSVGILAFLQIAAVASLPQVAQPLLVAFGLVWAASLAGFLPLNFPNAKAYLGDGGSMIIGFTIGVLSIISGAKIATAGSVMGWFILDLLLVWVRRVVDGRNPLTSADRFHWHQRLVDTGLSKIQVLVLTLFLILVTAQLGLLVQTEQKIYVLIGQGLLLLSIFGLTYKFNRRRK